MHDSLHSLPQTQMVPLPDLVKSFLQQYSKVWWDSEKSLPEFNRIFSILDQKAGEKQLAALVDGLVYELKHIPFDPDARQGQQERLRERGLRFAAGALNLEPRHRTFIESTGILAACEEFAQQAREFDPQLRGEDIYQASRNVMTMNFLQLLLGLPVEVTPSVFAYSLLYPYTDNYLDDPSIPQAVKAAFNYSFRHRLEGEGVHPANAHEAAINDLVGMIESQWSRSRFPQVYDSLLAIHTAQVRSLALVVPGASPYELDVLGVSFEKGGASVLADGYLVAGELTPEQAMLMFGYGTFTQLIDDLEDVLVDQKEGRMTIFTQTAMGWPLDSVTNQLFHYGRTILGDLSVFQSPATGNLKELIERSIDPLLIDSIGQAGKYYRKDYLRKVERHIPFRFDTLQKQREKLNRQKVTLERLIETFLLLPGK